jgi:tRNA(Arg) A34 adenosine deaminase TadA
MSDEGRFLGEAIDLARANIARGGRPFGAVVVKEGAVIARGVNEIHATNDPTSHAELNALRAASRALGSPDLSGCVVYASGHPCPMCLAAMRLARVERAAFAYSNAEGAPFGLSTAPLYEDLSRPIAAQAMPMRQMSAPEPAASLYGPWAQAQQELKGA